MADPPKKKDPSSAAEKPKTEPGKAKPAKIVRREDVPDPREKPLRRRVNYERDTD